MSRAEEHWERLVRAALRRERTGDDAYGRPVGGKNRRYFGLKTVMRGVVEFECRNQREYDVWTQGVSRLLSIAAERSNRNRI